MGPAGKERPGKISPEDRKRQQLYHIPYFTPTLHQCLTALKKTSSVNTMESKRRLIGDEKMGGGGKGNFIHNPRW